MSLCIARIDNFFMEHWLLSALFVCIALFAILSVTIWDRASKPTTHIEGWPSITFIFLRAVIGFFVKSRKLPNHLTKFPDLQVSLTKPTKIDRSRLDRFYTLTGIHASPNHVPFSFFIVESFRLCLYLLTHPLFPVTVVGGVLSKYHSKLYHRVALDSKLKYKCRVDPELRRTEKGHAEVDVIIEALLENERVAWRSITTVVLINPSVKRTKKPTTVQEVVAGTSVGTVYLAEDSGRQYGALNGDYNPIHLWKWSARIFGFKHPIVHALYLTALAVEKIQKATDMNEINGLSAEFRRPTLLPATLKVLHKEDVSTIEDESGRTEHFCVTTEDCKKEVIVGLLSYKEQTAE